MRVKGQKLELGFLSASSRNKSTTQRRKNSLSCFTMVKNRKVAQLIPLLESKQFPSEKDRAPLKGRAIIVDSVRNAFKRRQNFETRAKGSSSPCDRFSTHDRARDHEVHLGQDQCPHRRPSYSTSRITPFNVSLMLTNGKTSLWVITTKPIWST